VRLPAVFGAWIVAGASLGWGHGSAAPADAHDVASAVPAGEPTEPTVGTSDGPAFSPPPPERPEAPATANAAVPEPPATRYVALTKDACESELVARAIPHRVLGPKRGMVAPVRLTGPLSGVAFHTLLPAREQGRSSYEILDCRLLLALGDLAKLLAAQDVVEVMYYSAYRPPPAGFPDAQLGERHDGGLAIDIGYFRTKDGLGLNVERDYQAWPGERPCAPAPPPRHMTRSSFALRKIACDAIEARLFNAALTPGYDPMHRDHFHFELSAGATWFVVR
jgi:hypothetical protein